MLLLKRIYRAIIRRKKFFYAFPLVSKLLNHKLSRISQEVEVGSLCSKFASILDCINRLNKWDNDKVTILKFAENYLNDNYNLFGCEDVHLINNKWNQDFRTKYIWPKGKAYFRYKIIDYSTHSDVKFPWDMSRSHHLLVLGQAYKLTKDEKYAKKIKAEIIDFIKNNPLMHSINWTCTMDVAIRAANWIYALALICESNSYREDQCFQKRIVKSFFEHCFFIEKNLEKFQPYSGNHYVANLAGLLHLYVILDIRDGRWTYALKEFKDEIVNQTLPSGFHFEMSTSYHKLVLEMFLKTYALLKDEGVEFDGNTTNRLISMSRFLSTITQPDGNIPFIGDNDNGRFLPFTSNGYADGLELIDIAKHLFPEENFECPQKSVFYSDARMAILRHREMYSLIHNNPISRYNDELSNTLHGSHTHCDMLSFTLSDGNHNIIVDPGTYCYTSDPVLRFKFRSTKMHNVFCIDGLDQQEQNKKDLFTLTQYSFPVLAHMKGENAFEGIYDYIVKGSRYYRHERVISLLDKQCKVKDKVTALGEHYVTAFYHLSPDIQVKVNEEGVLLVFSDITYLMTFQSDKSFNISINSEDVSPSYGSVTNSSSVQVEFGNVHDVIELTTTIKRC